MDTIRVVARVRPLQKNESPKDVIVTAINSVEAPRSQPTLVRIPSVKNENEDYTFQFSSVYDQQTVQQTVFDNEISPTIKHLFNGTNLTIFAYGATGTGKTYTMRGGKSLADRGVIPRLLSSTYRRSRKLEKDSAGKSSVCITMSYYEIYNDKIFDLLEAPEKRPFAGLQLRDHNGKTIVVGLTERPCESLKEFEKLYDQANINRSTSATKLNAHSSRSHAILRLNVKITTGDQIRVSTASAIDLAGSEDNRRTDNNKERLVESASINKSLFVLANCVEAITQKQSRIPYRESKMTRILSLGQNDGLTVMILNLAPTRSYHLDTLSSLNFANRTKTIETRKTECEPIVQGLVKALPLSIDSLVRRQPLRPLNATVHDNAVNVARGSIRQNHKPMKAFSVYTDKSRASNALVQEPQSDLDRCSLSLKRPSQGDPSREYRPAKRRSTDRAREQQPLISKAAIEDIIEKKVTDLLAARTMDQSSTASLTRITGEVRRRLELLEQKIEGQDDWREQGLNFLLMAKQHLVRGEDTSALRMFLLAKEYFPDNDKLDSKIVRLQNKLKEEGLSVKQQPAAIEAVKAVESTCTGSQGRQISHIKSGSRRGNDDSFQEDSQPESEDEYDSSGNSRRRIKSKPKRPIPSALRHTANETALTPGSRRLLRIINSGDIGQIKLLQGIGAKRAEAMVKTVFGGGDGKEGEQVLENLSQLAELKGVGWKTVEKMRLGLKDEQRSLDARV
ncbi:MAG: hypothetical protein Q9167_000042 [Letrouitia subvulpina]